MKFLVLWSGLVSRVGASYRVDLVAPFLLGQCGRLRVAAPDQTNIQGLKIHVTE